MDNSIAIVFKKKRRSTPFFRMPTPWNPLQGDQANLRQDGTSPFCAMMQVASADVYDDYVICRGFDPRILRFIDYAAGDANKPGISVAKPFGKRKIGTYEIGEIYPAFLPTQGNANFQDFRQVVFVPPSPVAVNWRVGQNPGVVTGGLEGGQPEGLSDTVGILYDHNGKVVNWLLIDSNGGGGATIQFTVDSITIAGTSSPYNGKKVATVTIEVAPCSRSSLIGTSAEVVDWSGCVWDLAEVDLIGVWGWASEYVALSLEAGVAAGTLTPCHWGADDRCCVAADSV